MRAISVSVVVCALAIFAAPPAGAEVSLVHSSDGYTYFNKAGADWATHNAALDDCWMRASQTRTTSVIIGKAQAMYPGAMASFEQERGVQVNLENCMVAHGWRVVRVPDAEGASLAALPRKQLAEDYLSGWVGAETPHGEVVRSWANEAANGSTVRVDVRPNYSGRPSLSLTAQASPKPQYVDQPATMFLPQSALPPKALKADQLGEIKPGSAVIVLTVKGGGFRNGMGLILLREGPDLLTPAWLRDQQPDQIQAGVALMAAKSEGNVLVYAAPAGRWRVASLYGGVVALSLCLGAPAFEVGAGEVVFAGTIDFEAADLTPDMTMDQAKAYMAARPDLAEKMRPAVYENGNPGVCGGSFIYALDFKGAAVAKPRTGP